MRLDIDCVRDVMLELEGFPIGSFHVSSFKESIEKYGYDAVVYTLTKLIEADFINAGGDRTMDGLFHIGSIVDLTFQGHQFLEAIREKSVWLKTKSILSRIGASGFSLVSQVATSILTDAASTYLKNLS